MLNSEMKADFLGFKLADGRIFPLLNLKKQTFAKAELQPADTSMGKVCLHFVLYKKGKPEAAKPCPESLTLEYTPEESDELILNAFRSGSNFVSLSLFPKKNPQAAVKTSVQIVPDEEIETIQFGSQRRRTLFLKIFAGIFGFLAICAAIAFLCVLFLPPSLFFACFFFHHPLREVCFDIFAIDFTRNFSRCG